MGRQAEIAFEAFAGSSRQLRLDPFTLPVRYTATLGGVRPSSATILIDRDEAIIRRGSSVGTQLTVRLPVKAFEGVAVRMTPIGHDGDIEVVVELRHGDPALSLPLIIADDPADVSADWQAWGRVLRLPLLVVGEDGNVSDPVDRIGPLTLQPLKPRRRHSFFAGRRPRFLTRRKPGRPGPLQVLTADEIIARD